MKKSNRWLVAQYFEVRWWKNYLKNKDVNNYLTWKKQYWNSFLEKISTYVKPTKELRILDAGCGPAGIFIALQDNNVVAIDPLLDQYNEQLDHFNRNSYPSTKFETTTLEDFERPESFDLVFCLNAINHVSDLKKAFKQLYNCTEKGGTIVVSIDAHNFSFLKHIFRLQPSDILHPHQYDLKEYQQMLKDLDCSVLQSVLIQKGFIFNYYVLVAKKN